MPFTSYLSTFSIKKASSKYKEINSISKENKEMDNIKPNTQKDLKNENMYAWAFFSPSGSLTKAYYDVFYIAYHNFVYGNTAKADKGNANAFAQAMINGLDQASSKLKKLNKWS